MLPLMTVVPIIQLILLSFAASNEVKDVRLAVVNQDYSAAARLLIQKIEVAERFILVDFPVDVQQGDALLQEGEVDIVLHIPANFERQFYRERTGQIQLLVNAINGQQATVGSGYLNTIIQAFNQEMRAEVQLVDHVTKPNQIQTTYSNWYNSDLNYKYFMAPGILGELVTILIMLLTAMNVVREREIGTIEQINVTPIKKWQFILGKMVPFLLIGLVLMSVGLTAAKLLFDIPIRGSIALIFAYCVVNLMAVLGLGLFISNLSGTQQQAMFTTFFFVIIFILMSGLFTPIESMPKWAQHLTIPNPIAHFVTVMRSVLLKGSTFTDILFHFRATVAMAVVFNGLAIWSYRKVS